MRRPLALSLLTVALALLSTQWPAVGTSQAPVSGLQYDAPFFPGARYDPAIPAADALLGFPVGARAATHAEIERCLRAWDEASPRTRLVEHGRTWEGRPLYHLVVSSPQNLTRLDEIQAGWAKVADPRSVPEPEAEGLAGTLPAVAWLGYSIHGDETSGADASLAVAYHLTASLDPEAEALLRELVVILDPMMNPDGRDRYLQQVAQHRSGVPNLDDQSLLHQGYWPAGRGNHYLFDLNRDWIFAVHPETRGRVRAVSAWHPLLFVDAHEMGALETYLFYPPREPLNPNLPEHVRRWWDVFGEDQAKVFDRRGWRYYTGEWAESWAPVYSDSWSALRGAVGILYEQAGITEDAVRRPEGTLVTYREAVHHQAVSSLANLETLRANRAALARDFLASRRRAVAASGPYARRIFAVLPTANRSRSSQFVDLLRLQGIEVFELAREERVRGAVDALGRTRAETSLPPGTLLIPNRQPEAHLLAAMLEPDPRPSPDFLQRERRELLLHGDSLMYDVTGWSVPLLYGLETLVFEGELPAGAAPVPGVAPSAAVEGGMPDDPQRPLAYVFDGAEDLAVAAAARLMERGVAVRVADRDLRLDGRDYSRGSVVVIHDDNRGRDAEMEAAVGAVAAEVGLAPAAVSGGLGPGDAPDLGGRHFVRLEPPRVAVVSRGAVRPAEYGALWLTLDRHLGIRHSHLDEAGLDGADLRRYNVLIVPPRWGEALPEGLAGELKGWLEAGGTLIAVGSSAAALAAEKPGVSRVRTLPDALEKLDDYRVALWREWVAQAPDVDPAAAWSHMIPERLSYPWQEAGEEKDPPLDELRRRDRWQETFMPQGAILAGRVDPEHWLTFGCRGPLPILFGSGPVLMAGVEVEAPVRFGQLEPEAAATPGAVSNRIGWAPVPRGHRLYLRLSGILWPEAAHRLANAAYVTRERVGDGQVILFAGSPVFRGATLATRRLFTNAVVFGPGFGASSPVLP